jgi:hypothetical protein
VVAGDFTPQAMAASLNRLDHSQINSYKERAHAAAAALSADSNRQLLLELVERVLAEAA